MIINLNLPEQFFDLNETEQNTLIQTLINQETAITKNTTDITNFDSTKISKMTLLYDDITNNTTHLQHLPIDYSKFYYIIYTNGRLNDNTGWIANKNAGILIYSGDPYSSTTYRTAYTNSTGGVVDDYITIYSHEIHGNASINSLSVLIRKIYKIDLV